MFKLIYAIKPIVLIGIGAGMVQIAEGNVGDLLLTVGLVGTALAGVLKVAYEQGRIRQEVMDIKSDVHIILTKLMK